MGLFEFLFRRPARSENGGGTAWETLTAYRPAFTSWDGKLYENELIRAAVDAIARHTSKLEVTFNGSAKPRLRSTVRYAPNPWQTWSQFLYRLRTIWEMNGTAFIVPMFDDLGQLEGYFPALPSQCEIVQFGGEPYLRYTFTGGKKAAIELALCGILTKYQYQDDIFGTGNAALNNTMNLLTMQQQGITEGVRNGATFRFMAKLSNFMKPEDLAKERRRFNRENLQDESGGLLLFPNTYSDIQQIDQKPYVVDHDQMELIQNNVFNYFGISKEVLQNNVVGDAWNAFYEGGIEPWAIQFGEVMTRMTYTAQEIARGNEVFATSNRMQYLNNADKLNVSAQLLDRGILNRDEARSIWNLPPLPNGEGQAYVIRGEYVNANEKINGEEPDADPDDGGGSSADGDGTGESAGKGSAGPGPEVSAGSVPEVLGADGAKAGA